MPEAILHISKANTLDEDVSIDFMVLQMTDVTSVIIQMDENSKMLSIQNPVVINTKVGQTEHINAQQEGWSH